MVRMNAEEKYAYWLDSAEYDLATAEAMQNAKRWVYVVFMCQQSIEKLLKGLYVLYIDDDVPRIHSLSSIYRKLADKLPETADETLLDLFDSLSAFYLSGRYTEYKERISKSVNSTDANDLLARTREAFKWLLTQRP